MYIRGFESIFHMSLALTFSSNKRDYGYVIGRLVRSYYDMHLILIIEYRAL